MHCIAHTNSRCLTRTQMRFGALFLHLQGVPSQLVPLQHVKCFQTSGGPCAGEMQLSVTTHNFWIIVVVTIHDFWNFLEVTIHDFRNFMVVTIHEFWNFVVVRIHDIWNFLVVTIHDFWNFFVVTIHDVWNFVVVTIQDFWNLMVVSSTIALWNYINTSLQTHNCNVISAHL